MSGWAPGGVFDGVGDGGAGPHPSADEIALFVIDALEAPARRQFERHVSACAACAQALATEAAAEIELAALWPAVERPLAPVLALPVAGPRPQPRPPTPLAVPASAPVVAQPRTARPSAARGSMSSSGFSAFAAAVVTVLFMGHWTSGGRGGVARPDLSGLARIEATVFAEAFCPVGDVGGVCVAGEESPPAIAATASPPPMCRAESSCGGAALLCLAPGPGLCAAPPDAPSPAGANPR